MLVPLMERGKWNIWTISSAGMSIRLTCGRSQVRVLYRPPRKSPGITVIPGFFRHVCWLLIAPDPGRISGAVRGTFGGTKKEVRRRAGDHLTHNIILYKYRKDERYADIISVPSIREKAVRKLARQTESFFDTIQRNSAVIVSQKTGRDCRWHQTDRLARPGRC